LIMFMFSLGLMSMFMFSLGLMCLIRL